jgi:hypothetical protein
MNSRNWKVLDDPQLTKSGKKPTVRYNGNHVSGFPDPPPMKDPRSFNKVPLVRLRPTEFAVILFLSYFCRILTM